MNFHTAFNLTMGLVFLPFTAPFARLCTRLVPDEAVRENKQEPRNLDPNALSSPPIALACAMLALPNKQDSGWDTSEHSACDAA